MAQLGGPIQPNLAGFVDAQQRLRSQFGEPVWFIKPSSVTFAPNTNIDPSTGQPFDPAIKPIASAAASASAQCNVFFRAISRGGMGHEFAQSAADIRNWSLVMLITDISNRSICQGAVQVLLRGDTWKVMSEKPDGLGDTQRWLVYVKQI